MALERINVKANPALAAELASAGGHTAASLALFIIGLHACGRNVQAYSADAYRALTNPDLPNDLRSALESAIKGVDIRSAYVGHTRDIQPTYERMSEPVPAYQPDMTPDCDTDDLDFDDPLLGSVGLSV